MSVLDLDNLLTEISPAQPAGSDFEYHPAFGALERSADSTPGQSHGDTEAHRDPVNWKRVKADSIKLLSQTKDLRIATLLVKAALHTNGMVGFSEGLSLINGLLESYWDTMHPLLDPDDYNDPTLRINTISTLRSDEMLASLQSAPLIAATGLRKYSLRYYRIANGDISANIDNDSMDAPDLDKISAAFLGCQIDELKSAALAVSSALASVERLDSFLMNQVGAENAIDFVMLTTILKEASVVLNNFLGKRNEEGRANEVSDPLVADPAVANQSPVPANTVIPSQSSLSLNGNIGSRIEAAQLMDKISEYFIKNEPSSPVPLLMQRAKRLSSLGFMEILEDLAPEGLSQAKNNIGDLSLNDN